MIDYQLANPLEKNHIYRLLRRDSNGVAFGGGSQSGLERYVQVSIKSVSYLLQEATAVFMHDITIQVRALTLGT